MYFWNKYNLGLKFYAPQVRPDKGLNLWPPDRGSIFHVTETPCFNHSTIHDIYFHVIIAAA